MRREFTVERRARGAQGKVLVALDDVNLQVHRGELFGLLGPNGAGKTTLIRILATLLTPTRGKAFIEGHDVVKEAGRVRPLINMVSGGETCGYGILTARENLRLFTELYGIPWKVAKPRVDWILKVVGLDDKQGVRVNRLSTGMRQRLNFARGFTTDPQVLFLDEPTVGLDVHSALEVRRFVRQWLDEHPDRTILLTTHYMAEAEELCDRVAIVDRGRVVACDSPAALKRTIRREAVLELTLAGVEPPPLQWRGLPGVVRLEGAPRPESRTWSARVILEGPEVSAGFLRVVVQDGRKILDLKTVEPTLEDVFLELTGKLLSQDSDEAAGTGKGGDIGDG